MDDVECLLPDYSSPQAHCWSLSQADGRAVALHTDCRAVEEEAEEEEDKTRRKTMSMTMKKGISAKAESRKCAARFWRLFPHLLLSLSLVAYAALGALMFEHIEGKNALTTNQEYHEFLGQIVSTIQNLTSKWPQISVLVACQLILPCNSTFKTNSYQYFWTFYIR